MSEWNFQRVVTVKPEAPYQLYIEFDDGVSGIIDISETLKGSVFEPLKNPDFFSQVSLDDWGAPCWPNGVDLAPDALYEKIAN